jgi:hypothetical protein
MYPGLNDTDARIARLRHDERLVAVARLHAAQQRGEPRTAAIRGNARQGWFACMAARAAQLLAAPTRRVRTGTTAAR